jgi:hypothetical protein
MSLSDFAYGQRLYTYDDGKQYAFINLLETEVFDSYDEMMSEVLMSKGVKLSNDELINTLNNTFGITFDKIDGYEIDNAGRKRQCEYCGSVKFDSVVAEPVTQEEIKAALITQEDWLSYSDDEKKKKIKEELKRIGLIRK